MCYNETMKLRANKRCPRCNIKMPITMGRCPNCQLDFSKFETATNKGAKQAYNEGEPEQVILRKGYPSDVKKWKLVLLTIFLGIFGVHYFYVGRKRVGFIFILFFFVGVLNAIITTLASSFTRTDIYQIFYLFVLGWGIVLILWLVDIFKVALNKFKIPVSVERKWKQ